MPGTLRTHVVVLAVVSLFAATLGAAYAVTVPSAPRSPNTLVTATTVKLSWQAPSTTGGSAITGYLVQRYNASLGKWATIARPGGTARSYTDINDSGSPITAGRKYSYRVRARNAAGVGPASATVTATPYAPTAPRSPVASAALVRVELDWLAPSATGGTPISAYVVQRRDPGTSTWKAIATQPGSVTAYTDANDASSPVAAGSAYSYRVLARNTGGTSTPSTVVAATPTGCPTNNTSTLYVDPTATRIGTIPATGVSDPAACAFSRISDAIDAADAGGVTEIQLEGGTAESPAVYGDEEFPLTLPPGVGLSGDPTDAGRPVIRFTGAVAYALEVHGSTVSGIELVNARESGAGQLVICTGGTNTFQSVLLNGTGGAGIDRGLWVWPGCWLDLVGSRVSSFQNAGVLTEPGSQLKLDASEVSHNLGDGLVVRGTLTGGAGAESLVGWNGDDGILIEASPSAEIVNAIIRSNDGNGIEVHPSKTSILQSRIFNNSRNANWDQPQLLFVGEATDGPLLHNPATGTDQPAYVVSVGSLEACQNATRISGYDTNPPTPTSGGLRAEEGAVVDARHTSWVGSPSVTVTAGSYVETLPACQSILQADPG